MKKIRFLLLVLFSLSFFLIHSQNIEKTFRPEFFSTVNFITPYGEDKILIGGEGRKDFKSKPVALLTMIDTIGNSLWEYDFTQNFPSYYEQIEVLDVQVKNDEYFVSVGASCCCDVGPPAPHLFKIDETGQILDSTATIRYSGLVEFGDKHASINYFSVSILDENFQYLVSDYLFPSSHFYNLTDIAFAKNQLLVSTIKHDDLCGLVRLTVQDFGLGIYSVDEECLGYSEIENIESNGDGLIYIQNENHIIALDSALNAVNEIFLPDSAKVINLKYEQDRLLVFMDSMSNYFVRIYGDDLNQLNEIAFEQNLKIIPKDGFLRLGKLYVVGEERSLHQDSSPYSFIEEDSRSTIFFRTYNLDGINEFPMHDIGISEVTTNGPALSSPNLCNYYEFPDCGPTETIKYDDVAVTITNYGDQTLNECTVNARIEHCGNCSYFCARTFTFSKKYENLNLSPGASVEVQFGDIIVGDQPVSAIKELCLWTANPNNFIDKDISNDHSCLDVIVKVDEVVMDATEVELYPNPSNTGEVFLDTKIVDKQKRVIIFDSFGKIVEESIIENGVSSTMLNVNDLAKGIYFINIKIESKSINKKLILN